MNNMLYRKFLAVLIAVIVLLCANLALAEDYSVTAGNWQVDFKSNETLYTEVKEESNYIAIWVKEDPGMISTRSGSIQLFEYDNPTPFGKEALKGWMSLYISSINETPNMSDYLIDGTDAVIAEGWDPKFGRMVYGAIYPIDKNTYGSAQKSVGFLSLLDRKTNFEILDSLHVKYVDSPQAPRTSTTTKTNNWVYTGGSQETAQQAANSGMIEPYVLIKCEGILYDELGSYTEAGTGKVYLVTDLQIENHGYDEFSVNPNYVKVEINNVQYDYSWVGVDDVGLASLDSVTLKDGGIIKGAVAFEIPQNTNQYSLVWKAWESYNVKVEYVK